MTDKRGNTKTPFWKKISKEDRITTSKIAGSRKTQAKSQASRIRAMKAMDVETMREKDWLGDWGDCKTPSEVYEMMLAVIGKEGLTNLTKVICLGRIATMLEEWEEYERDVGRGVDYYGEKDDEY